MKSTPRTANMSSMPKFPASLEEDSSITKLDDKTYAAKLSPSFCIGAVPNGGYVANIFLRVARAHLSPRNQPDTIIGHWEFFNRTLVGPAILIVEEVKPGRLISVLHITIYQDGLLTQHPWISPDGKSPKLASAYLTNRLIEAEKGITLRTGWTMQPELPPVDFAKLTLGQDPNWETFFDPIMNKVAAMRHFQYFWPRKGKRITNVTGSLDIWMRFAIREAFTSPSLALVMDLTPAMTVEMFRQRNPEDPIPENGFAYDKSFWFPTLVMNLEVKKALPREGEEWLLVRTQAKRIDNGRFDTEALVFDMKGDLVAQSQQVAMIVDMARNSAARESTKKVTKI